jgi:hypothetical protein
MKKILLFTLFIIFSGKIFAQIDGKTSSFDAGVSFSKENFKNQPFIGNSSGTKFGVGHAISKYFFANASFQNYDFKEKENQVERDYSFKNYKSSSAEFNGTFLFRQKKRFIPFISTGISFSKLQYKGYDTWIGEDFLTNQNLVTKKIGIGAHYFFNPTTALKMSTSFAYHQEREREYISRAHSINVELEMKSFLQNNHFQYEKESKENRFVNDTRMSLSGKIKYDFQLSNYIFVQFSHNLNTNLEFQRIISDNVHFGVKMESNLYNIVTTPMMGYYIRLLPNFYINPRIGCQIDENKWRFFLFDELKIYPFGGLNLEYFLNKNLSYRIATSATFEDGLENLNLSSGFNYYLK